MTVTILTTAVRCKHESILIANARLIAAAPDLLDVCQQLLAAYERERQRIPIGASSQAEAAAAVKLKRAARAAIAKADPKTSPAAATAAIEKACG